MKSVIVDPSLNIYYGAFYIEGLYRIFGKKRVKFDAKPFQGLSLKSRVIGLLFVVKESSVNTKYVVNFDDFYTINDELYQWCDVYGNVNANFNLTSQKYHAKLISLAPSFGIRIWSLPQITYYAITNLLKSKLSTKEKFNARKFLGNYKRMYQLRLSISEYATALPQLQEHSYIFHLSTLWYSDQWNKNDEGVNKTRANFVRACKSIKRINFVGGLVSQGSARSSEDLFKDCLFQETVTMDKWIENTKKSLVVFNTPAFWNCHGWKLGEYLALGKAIISTKLYNDLPAPLEHGVNIHIVEDNEESIKEAVTYILQNKAYRLQLETGAKEYWNKYCTPLKVFSLLGIDVK